jgi:5-methylcytosine-specific restriction endonuclease McrA
MVKSGLIRINGFLYKLTDDGRFRRHWKGEIRTADSRLYRSKKHGICPVCGLVRDLTVDHNPPLRESVANPEKVLICKECHHRKNRLEAPVVNGISGTHIQNCGKGHNTYLRDDLTVYCRVCNRVLNRLVKVSDDEYVTIDKQGC